MAHDFTKAAELGPQVHLSFLHALEVTGQPALTNEQSFWAIVAENLLLTLNEFGFTMALVHPPGTNVEGSDGGPLPQRWPFPDALPVTSDAEKAVLGEPVPAAYAPWPPAGDPVPANPSEYLKPLRGPEGGLLPQPAVTAATPDLADHEQS
jgi:hypothetical protein